MAPGTPVIDLFADAPAGNARASAYLLAAYAVWFPAGSVFLCVVDPGVGGTRPAMIVKADGRWYVGPGNGPFELIQRRARDTLSWDIDRKPITCQRAFTGATSLPRSRRCWRAVTRRPGSCGRMAQTGGRTGPTILARLSTLIISATR